MADLSARDLVSSKASERAAGAARLRELTSRFELLLDQAEGFVRGSDYLGGQARARYACEELPRAAAAARVSDTDIDGLRQRLELRLRHYDLLARDWQDENRSRQATYVARERGAIGANMVQASEPEMRRTGFINLLRRLWTSAFGSWTPGPMKVRPAP
jgi:hypothetical protein